MILLEEFLGLFYIIIKKSYKLLKEAMLYLKVLNLMNYKLHRVHLKRGGSYVKSSEWLANKKATINPKNENDDECLRWSIICALNYNEIMKKEFENIFKKIKHEDKDFSSQKTDWENFEQNSESIALNVLFSSQDSEEITLVYKSEHNYNRENNVLLLIINDDDENVKHYYFAVKSKSELYSSE